MGFLLTATALLLVVSVVLSFLLMGGPFRGRFRRGAFWRRLCLVQTLLLPFHVLVALPGILGYAGSRLVHTRPDEAGYVGPWIDDAGVWHPQDRGAPRPRERFTATELRELQEMTLHIKDPEGHRCRAFYVRGQGPDVRGVAILVHGLFRGAMELEPVGVMFREMGLDVVLVELLDHGGSDRHPFTFGAEEHEHVLAVVDYLRARADRRQPVLLFGVSLGGVAAALAAPKIEGLAGLVLDAPMVDLERVAYRMFGRKFGFPDFFTWLVLRSMETWSDFHLEDIDLRGSYRALPPDLPVLFIGAGSDWRAPPAVAEEAFGLLRGSPPQKELWIAPGTEHGRVWVARPEEYREHLRRFVDRALGDRHR